MKSIKVSNDTEMDVHKDMWRIFIASFPIDDTSSSLVPNEARYLSISRGAAFKASTASLLLYEEN